MQIPYNTRDGQGKDFVKMVDIKEFQVTKAEYDCPICGKHQTCGVPIKKIVSSNFTDWERVGEYVCEECSRLFSLYFYSYIIENGDIRIINVREIRDNILRNHQIPFKLIITKSRKKHLFYLATENMTDDSFAIQLETETIFTNRNRQRVLFDFVECLQVLGQSKQKMLEGNLMFKIMQMPFGIRAYEFLQAELRKREIQIPLYCGQKREITEEEAICCLNSVLMK